MTTTPNTTNMDSAEIPAKRGRGRPPKPKPAEASTEPKRGPGRPPKAREVTAVVKPQPGSAAAARVAAEDAQQRAVVGLEIVQSKDEPFHMLSTPKALETRGIQLVGERNIESAELARTLFTLQEQNYHLERGKEDFFDYVDEVFHLGRSNARALISGWIMLCALEIPAGALRRVSWGKLMRLAPGVKANVITPETILSWLPFCETDGRYALRIKDIDEAVKAAIRENAGDGDLEVDESSDGYTDVKVKVPKNKLPSYLALQEVCLRAFKCGKNELELKVYETLAASIMDDNNTGASEGVTLADMMAAIEARVPKAQVVLLAPDTEDYSEDVLGIIPYTRLYVGERDGVNQFILANSLEAAQLELGIHELVEIPLHLASHGKPEEGSQADSGQEEQEEGDEVSDVDYQEEVDESEVPELTPVQINNARELTLNKIEEPRHVAVIKHLIKPLYEKGVVTKEEFAAKRVSLAAEYEGLSFATKGVFVDLCMWLYEKADEVGISLEYADLKTIR